MTIFPMGRTLRPRSPLGCINVLDAIRLGKPEEFRDAFLIGRSHTAPEKIRQESSSGAHFRELAALTITAASLHVCYTTSHPSPAAVWHFLTQQGTFAEAITTMRTTAHTSHGVHQAIAEMSGVLHNIGSGDELGSAWSTTIRPLLLYLDPHVAASTDRSTRAIQFSERACRSSRKRVKGFCSTWGLAFPACPHDPKPFNESRHS